jgi:predicted SnoaL-like aldol condensation-catalyzing enzyme
MPPILLRLLSIGVVAVLSAACSTPRFLIEAENARTNTHIVLAFEETVFNKHRVHEGFDRYVAADYKEHDPMLVDGADAAARALNNQLSTVYPNSRLIVKRTVAQGDLVAVHAFWDRTPQDRQGVARVDIYRLVNARIAEHWMIEQPVPDGQGDTSNVL